MKYLYYLLIFFSVIFIKAVQSQTYDWSAVVNPNSQDMLGALAADVTEDKWGNIINIGWFQYDADFDPDTGIYQLPLNFNGWSPSDYDIYIQKLDSAGNLLWAKSFGTQSNNDFAWDLEVDTFGNIYMTGVAGYGLFDIDPDSTTLYIPGKSPFVLKLNPEGEYLWHKALGVNYTWSSVSDFYLELDYQLNIYLSGTFNSTVDFDPDSTAVHALTAVDDTDIFLCKLDSLGEFEWVKNMGGTACTGLDLGINNELIIAGTFNDTTDVDPGPDTSYISSLNYSGGCFITLLDSSGDFQWTRHSINSESFSYAGFQGERNSISSDADGNIYSAINFSSLPPFYSLDSIFYDQFDLTKFYIANNVSSVIQKYNHSGNLLWSRLMQSTGTNYFHRLNLEGIETDYYGNVYLVGDGVGTVWFGADSLEVIFANNSSNYRKGFMVKLDTDGEFQWGFELEPTNLIGLLLSSMYGIHITEKGKILSSGVITYDIDMDPGAGVDVHDGKGAFTLVLNGCQAITDTSYTEMTICHGDSLYFQNGYQDSSGLYIDTLIKPYYECFDTTIQYTTLIVLDSVQQFWNDTILCYGDSIWLAGTNQGNAGWYADTLWNTYGCDSIIYHTNLTILEQYTLQETDTITCYGDSILLGQSYQSTTGQYYTDTTYSTNGCDSIIYSTQLTVIPAAQINTTYTSLCYGDSLLIHGNWESTAGLYHLDTVYNQNQCDSIVYDLVLNFSGPLQNANLDTVICFGEILQIGTQSFDSTGFYLFDTLLTQLGCDSLLLSLNLTVEDEVYTIQRDTTICEGDPIFLGGGWQNEEYIYVDTLYSIMGCDSAILYTDLTIQPGFTIDFGADLDLCAGEEYILDPSIPNASYVWQDGSTDSIFTILETGTYWVEMTIGACVEKDTIAAYFYSPPSFSFPDDTLLCEGDILDLSALTLHAVYQWQDGSDEYHYEVSEPGLYWVELNIPGCGNYRDSITVSYWERPQPSLGGDTVLCEGETLVLDVSDISGIYEWQDGSTGSNYTVTEAGTYGVSIENEHCTGEDFIHIIYTTIPEFDLGEDTLICEGASLDFHFEDSLISFLWQDGSTYGEYQMISSGTYWLEQSNICGTYRDSIVVSVDPCHPNIEMPNVFSPNGDGINDTYHPVHLENVTVFSFVIYDRWGMQVYQSQDGLINWDGAYEGTSNTKAGAYFWMMKYSKNDGGKVKDQKGTIQLVK